MALAGRLRSWLLTGCSSVAQGPATATPATNNTPTHKPRTPTVGKENDHRGRAHLLGTTHRRPISVCRQETMKAAPPRAVNIAAAGPHLVTSSSPTRAPTRAVIKGFPTVAFTGSATGHRTVGRTTILKMDSRRHGLPCDLGARLRGYCLVDVPSCHRRQCSSGCGPPNRGALVLRGCPTGGIELLLSDGSDFITCGDTVTGSLRGAPAADQVAPWWPPPCATFSVVDGVTLVRGSVPSCCAMPFAGRR